MMAVTMTGQRRRVRNWGQLWSLGGSFRRSLHQAWTVELFQAGLARVADTTYSGRLFSLSASWPLRDGHRAASHS